MKQLKDLSTKELDNLCEDLGITEFLNKDSEMNSYKKIAIFKELSILGKSDELECPVCHMTGYHKMGCLFSQSSIKINKSF
jgi:hypothetical protein